MRTSTAACISLFIFTGLVRGPSLAAQAVEPPATVVDAPGLAGSFWRSEVLTASPAVLPSGAIPASWLPAPPAPEDALRAALAESSLARHVGWGAGIGAAAGVVSGLLVRSACGSYCDENVAQGLAIHIGIGALTGAGTGALVHWITSR